MKSFIVQNQVSIVAPRRIVWQALTNPDLTQQYFFGCRVNSCFIVGDPIIFKRRIFGLFPFELRGKILEINREMLLKYSLKNSKSISQSTVLIELCEDNGRTLVSITDDVGYGEGAESRYKRSVKGWDKILKGLKHLVEGQTI